MEAKTRRMIDFVRARIADDRAVALVARHGFAGETNNGAASAGHKRFVARFDPEWVAAEGRRKLMCMRAEVLQGAAVEESTGEETYHYPVVALLASAWSHHADYEDAWRV